MHLVLYRARRFQDLLALDEHDAPYAFNTIFDASSWSARRRSKRKFRLLRRVDERLRAVLQDGERVRYLTSGSGVSFWESYFLGWMMYYMNRRAIVLTDRRILLLQIDSRMRPRELLTQVRYSTIRSVKRSLLGNTKLRLGDGRTHVFTHVPAKDRKLLQNLSQWTGRSMERQDVGMEELCPHCHQVVDGRPTRCAACGGAFKSARRAGLLSLLFPGLGDLYIGHWKFALVEIAFASFIWLGVLLPNPELPTSPGMLLALAGFAFAGVHGADAIGTWYIARKGVYPARRPAGEPVRWPVATLPTA